MRGTVASLKAKFSVIILLLLSAFCMASEQHSNVPRLRFEKSAEGRLHSKATCRIMIDGIEYNSSYCDYSGVEEIFFGPDPGHDAKIHAIYITDNGGNLSAAWTGPEPGLRRPDWLLGRVVRDGDCWVNKKVNICVYGRDEKSIGKCFLSVKGHAYIDGPCPIETYVPNGDLYINGTCGAISSYSASVKVSLQGNSMGRWSGEQLKAFQSVALGRLTRQGACWVNDDVRLCAYKGQVEPANTCTLQPGQTPDGLSEPLPGFLTGVPNGVCSWDLPGRTSFSGECGVVASNNNNFEVYKQPFHSGDGFQFTTFDGVTTSAWNGGHVTNGSDQYSIDLGPMERVGDCWRSQVNGRICVSYPPLVLTCDREQACHWNIPIKVSGIKK